MRTGLCAVALIMLLPLAGCRSGTSDLRDVDLGDDEPAPTTASDPLTCSIDKLGTNRRTLTVQTLAGAEDAEWQFVTYQGHKAAVRFNAGDQFEGQRLLWMRLDDRAFKVYDPTKSLYKLNAADGVTIQCYDGTAVPPSKQDGTNLGCTIAKGGANPADVVPALVAGAEIAQPEVVTHAGHKASVTFNAGDEFDSQQLLSLAMDNYAAQAYDPGHSLTTIEAADGTAMQCYFGNESTSASVLD